MAPNYIFCDVVVVNEDVPHVHCYGHWWSFGGARDINQDGNRDSPDSKLPLRENHYKPWATDSTRLRRDCSRYYLCGCT